MARPTIRYTKTDPSRVTYLEKKDLYKRAVGYYPDAATPKVFYLTNHESESKSRALKLDQLWRERVAKGEKTWTDKTLKAASAIAKGQKRLEIEPVRISGIAVDGYNSQQVLEDSYNETQVDELENSVIPVVVAESTKLVKTGASLHATIEAYAKWIEKNTLTPGTKQASPYGVSSAGTVRRLKDAHPDCPMGQIGFIQLEDMTRYWLARPARKGTAKPIAVDTVTNQIGALRRFVRWASRHAQWRKPEDWMEATKYSRKHLATAAEKAARATPNQVKTYSVTELEMIWPYCTKWERCLVTLALNCAFGAAEIASLRMNEVDLATAKIKRIRGKNGVYGEHQLWPEMVELLQWAVERRRQIGKPLPTDFVLVRESGQPLLKQTRSGATSNKVAASWSDVLKKIRRDNPTFKKLSFKYLRKTAANLVRKISDGETAAVFLHHGQSVAEDELAEVYTDRDFEKLFVAQGKVHETLAKMFAQPVWTRGENRRDEIRRLKAEGIKPAEIAQQLHTSLATVYRYLSD